MAFRLDFEFSKSVFLHHMEIQLTAGRSGLVRSFSLPARYSWALFCCWELPLPTPNPPAKPCPSLPCLRGPWVSPQVRANLLPAVLLPFFVPGQLGYK